MSKGSFSSVIAEHLELQRRNSSAGLFEVAAFVVRPDKKSLGRRHTLLRLHLREQLEVVRARRPLLDLGGAELVAAG